MPVCWEGLDCSLGGLFFWSRHHQRVIVGKQKLPRESEQGVNKIWDIPGISWLPKRTHLAENK
jgi:hypothetical protein